MNTTKSLPQSHFANQGIFPDADLEICFIRCLSPEILILICVFLQQEPLPFRAEFCSSNFQL